MNKIYALSAAVVAVIFLGIWVFYQNIEQKKASLDNPQQLQAKSDVSKGALFWEKRIEQIGTERSYQEFKTAYAEETFNIQHPMAHIIGTLLYKKAGIKGFSVCDETYAYGCYHSFFESVFNDFGLDIIRDLDKACIEKYSEGGTGCQHGIGHGILAYLGRDKLIEALNYCRLTTQKNPLHGCTAGVFMENNISTHFAISSEGKVDVRKLNPNNPHEPCNELPLQDLRKSCYFEIPLWWKEVFGTDFQKLGTLCYDIPQKDERGICFQGLGVIIAPSTDYDVAKTIQLCKNMPDSYGEASCRTGAYATFSGNPKEKDKAKNIL